MNFASGIDKSVKAYDNLDNGNLLHQTKQPNAGIKITEKQVLKIEKDYKAGNLNKGKQKL